MKQSLPLPRPRTDEQDGGALRSVRRSKRSKQSTTNNNESRQGLPPVALFRESVNDKEKARASQETPRMNGSLGTQLADWFRG